MTNKSEAWEEVKIIRRKHGDDSREYKSARSKFYQEYGCSPGQSRRRIEPKNQGNGHHKHDGGSSYLRRKPDPKDL